MTSASTSLQFPVGSERFIRTLKMRRIRQNPSATTDSDKPLEPVLLCLADRTDPRRLIPCTEVPADLAPPHRERKREDRGQAGSFCTDFCRFSPAFRTGGPPLGNRCHLPAAAGNCLVHVQGTVTGTVLINIHIAVIAGADDIEVLLFLPIGKAARAGLVPVPLLVFQQAADQVPDKFRIRVEPVPAIGCILFQGIICLANITDYR